MAGYYWRGSLSGWIHHFGWSRPVLQGIQRCATKCSQLRHLRQIHRSHVLHEDIDQFTDFDTNSWQNYRVSAARQIGTDDIKRWPLHERIEAAGPGYINIARKTRNALRQIDRILDVFEPGQLALSFNGGKDSTALLHLFIAACAQHPTHSFTHIQPIWFRHPEYEFPELVKYIEDTAEAEFTHHEGLKAVDGRKLSRLWTMHIRDPQVTLLKQKWTLYANHRLTVTCFLHFVTV
jgi:hypothetical protein